MNILFFPGKCVFLIKEIYIYFVKSFELRKTVKQNIVGMVPQYLSK